MTQPSPHDSHGGPAQPKPRRPRRIMRLAKWGLALTVLFIALLMFAGFVYEQFALARIATNYPPSGELVDVEGRQIHMHVQGHGSPTVIFEAGLGEFSLGWHHVAAEVAQSTQVITYDRAGLGWSDPAPAPRDSDAVVQDLHAALQAQGIAGPYVLVGHSIGGVHVRMFSYRYPEEVKGIVLVDSSHEEQWETFPPTVREQFEQVQEMLWLFSQTARFGLVRLLDSDEENDESNIPKSIRSTQTALSARHSQLTAVAEEMAALLPSMRQTADAAIPWGDLPLEVLSAGKPMETTGETDAMEISQIWEKLQRDLASRSTHSKHQTLEDAGHYIQNDRPDVVIDAVLRVVEQAKNGSPPNAK
ncbi:Haloalkane dehalogenase [Symmachiella macrocystis]|uniref:Haloalkane dehalogenase n=1 Tax=Symmachiella macrocystis TaxID=2527985 RepID=A0A5C6BLQ3_9PLAN|nr:alpha/beta hydrolase [Symmachiella macrocystis]TWU11424.1 Haloalkane dehalogenase [Symmachiella macrocystis]